jgi:hypothetical protein
MGASGWSYFVPYQTDISKALQDLREAVFQKGEYYLRDFSENDMMFDELSPSDLDLTEEEKADYLAALPGQQVLPEERQALPKPTSIEALLQWNAEDGTHSIIDINKITPTPDFGAAAPLSNEELKRIFGTEKPTREMIKSKEKDFAVFLQEELGRSRWQGTYIVIYKENQPVEIYFIGYSGD